MIRHIAAVLCSFVAGNIGQACTTTLLQEKGNVSVKLVDAVSALELKHVAVTFNSDDGIVCVTGPCPTNRRSLSLTSDNEGIIVIPAGFMQSRMGLETDSDFADLIEDSSCAAASGWVVELLPKNRNYPTPPGAPRPLKLLDARSHLPIANQRAHIEFHGWNGAGGTLDLNSNALGYIFIPFDIVSRATDNTWIAVAGYSMTRADFAWARRKTLLQPR